MSMLGCLNEFISGLIFWYLRKNGNFYYFICLISLFFPLVRKQPIIALYSRPGRRLKLLIRFHFFLGRSVSDEGDPL